MEDEDEAPVPQSRAAFVTRFFNQVHLYRKLLMKFWWIPLSFIVLSVGIESHLLKHVPPAFVSTGRMIVNARLSIPNANVYSEELQYFFGTQVALMKSDSVVNRVNAHLKSSNPELNPVPVAIEVTLSPKTSIYDLQAKAGDPKYAQAYLQATMEEYIKLKKDLLTSTTTATQSGMEEEVKQLGAELEKSKQAVLDYQTSNSVVLLQPNGGNHEADYLLSLKKNLDEASFELLLLKTETLDQNADRMRGNFSKKNSASPSNSVAQSGSVPSSGSGQAPGGNGANDLPANLGGVLEAYLQTTHQLKLLKAQRDNEAKTLDPASRDMKDLNEQIAHLELELQIDKEQSQEQLANQEITLEKQIASLTNEIADSEQKTLDANKKLSEFEALKEARQRLQTLYDQMQANLQTLDVNKGIGQESVSILESAGPALPVPPETQKRQLMAGMIGGVLGFGVLLFISLLNDRPSSFSELELLFDLPILGQIPLTKSKNKKMPPVLQVDDERYPLIESYRSLRSALLYKDAVKGGPLNSPKSIVIASAYPSDGKSTTAANFAITLAQAGARVLLIDADLHRGVLHGCFSAAASPGLAEVFAGQSVWTDAVVATPFPNLFLLPRGVAPRHSGNLFAQSGKFLADVAGQFDYYIFDSAPVMMADDVLSLAPQADALILVVRAGFTSGRIAKAAMDLLRLRRVNVVGLVFNAVPRSTGDYYNYRAKEYYLRHSPAD